MLFRFGYPASMKTRILTLALIFIASHAFAQVAKWDTVRYEKWGFALQVPTGSAKQAVGGQIESETCDVYNIGGLACIVKVSPTSDTELASTVIEKAIQAEVKSASALGPAKRWEQNSKQGDLFKGFTAPVQIKPDSDLQAAVGKIISESEAYESISMAPLGDDTSPILRITVIGPKNRQKEIATTAKGVVAFMTRTMSASPEPTAPTPRKLVVEPRPAPKPKPAPVVTTPKKLIIEPKTALKPTLAPKPWPALKKGDIELSGAVNSISADGKTMMLCADSVKMPGQTPITLIPARPKKVMLRKKVDWLAAGQCVRIIGKNTGIGKPMTAGAVEKMPAP